MPPKNQAEELIDIVEEKVEPIQAPVSTKEEETLIQWTVNATIVAFFRPSKSGKSMNYIDKGKLFSLPNNTAEEVKKGTLIITQWEEGELLGDLISYKPVLTSARVIDTMLDTLQVIRNQQITESESVAMLNLARIRRELA